MVTSKQYNPRPTTFLDIFDIESMLLEHGDCHGFGIVPQRDIYTNAQCKIFLLSLRLSLSWSCVHLQKSLQIVER